ncbi:ribbon-helix-helix domain-containing protein [Peteryoungia desertarenae]|uniref:ribbon-helix-helix domain-containing protein n=1 Tax=Peteryoungia desertarenae TaxID=1813451 RepID=UPI001FEA410D|nr:ribbon-helix-helix domain-containing protein [Peteryoungia desertarenae]
MLPKKQMASPIWDMQQSGGLLHVETEEAEPRFRAVIGKSGERRGIRLEGIYWEALQWLASATRGSLSDIVEKGAEQVPDNGNLASILRVLAVKSLWQRLNAVEAMSSMENLSALVQASPSPTIVLTREKKIQLFNEPFVAMLRQRLALSTTLQLSAGFRFAVDTQIEDAISNLEANRGKMLVTGFTASGNGKTVNGQINLALAPSHQKQMVMGYIVR